MRKVTYIMSLWMLRVSPFFHPCSNREAFAVKRRVAQLALPPPKIAVAGEQAVPKQFWIGARGDPFDEVAGLPQQDLLDVLRVKQNVKAKIEEAVVDDVAILAGPAGERLGGIAAGHERSAHKGKSPGARGPTRS
jgi:hypothetical protein